MAIDLEPHKCNFARIVLRNWLDSFCLGLVSLQPESAHWNEREENRFYNSVLSTVAIGVFTLTFQSFVNNVIKFLPFSYCQCR